MRKRTKLLSKLFALASILIVSPLFAFPKVGNLSGRILYISVYNGNDQLVQRVKLNPSERVTLSACDQFVVYGITEPPTHMLKFSSCDREAVINESLTVQRAN